MRLAAPALLLALALTLLAAAPPAAAINQTVHHCEPVTLDGQTYDACVHAATYGMCAIYVSFGSPLFCVDIIP